MLQEDYQVTLDAFQGPLDLLLYLIRQAEVDITEIPLLAIIDQYLAFLTGLADVDVDQAGEFLVMAATLIEIKARSLVPEDQAAGDGSGGAGDLDPADPGYELVQQLLAYQRYRLAAEALDERRLAFAQRHPRAGKVATIAGPEGSAPDAEDEDASGLLPDLELEDVHILDLSQTYERIIGSIDFDKLGDHVVEVDDTPIELHAEDLIDRLQRTDAGRLSLLDAFEGASQGQRIGLFLATLELVRLRRVTVLQDEIDGDVVIVLNDDPE